MNRRKIRLRVYPLNFDVVKLELKAYYFRFLYYSK